MTEVLLKNTTPIQKNFLGFGAVYHGFAGLPDDAGRVYDDKLCDIEADRAADLGVTIARTYYKWYAYDFKKQCWDWDNAPDFVAFCKWVERLQKRNIDIALNVGWCSPGDILSNSWGGISPFTVENDWYASLEKYAEWVSETVHQLIEVRGFTNVKYLVFFTEPQNQKGLPPEAPHAYEAWYQATRAAADRLEKDGRRHLVKIIGPNEGSTTDPKMMKWLKENHPDLVDIYSAHNYLRTKSPIKFADNRYISSGYIRGMRLQQYVELKPNTRYEMTVVAMTNYTDLLNISGYMLMGAFDMTRKEGVYFGAGGNKTNRLTLDSAKMIDASLLTNEMKPYSFCFTTGENVESVAIGVFGDLVPEEATLMICEISLKESDTGVECLKNSTFQTTEHWEVLCAEFGAFSQYKMWIDWINTYLNYLSPEDDFWFDEYNTIGRGMFEDYDQPEHGTNLAIARVALLNSGIQSSLQWTLFDQQWPNNHTQNPFKARFYDGDHRYGIMPVLTRSLVPHPAYYAIAVTGKVGGSLGTKVYRGVGTGDIHISSTVSPNGDIAILVVNASDKPQEITINAEQPINCNLERYSYDPATVVPDETAALPDSDKFFENVSDTFTDTLPAGGVAVYCGKHH